MSPVVVIGFGALDAALMSQVAYAVRDLRRPDRRPYTPRAKRAAADRREAP